MTIVSGGVEAQVRQAFSNCEAVSICLSSSMFLAAVGITVFYVVSLSGADVRLMKAIIAEVLQVSVCVHPPPVSSTSTVSLLNVSGSDVERITSINALQA